MRIWLAAIGSRPHRDFDSLARTYLDRAAALLPGGTGKPVPKALARSGSAAAARTAIEAPVFRTEEALWQAVQRERARTSPLLVLLDERGKQMDSEAFAAWLGRELDGGRQLLVLAVGPPDGWGALPPVAADRRSDTLLLSLGPITLAHELARVVLCEQIYRALTILRGHPYHRAGNREGK